MWSQERAYPCSALWTSVKLQTADDSLEAEVKDFAFLPLARFYIGYHFSEHFELYIDVEGMVISSDKLVDSGIGFNWSIDYHRAAWVGYRFYDKDISTDKLTNRVSYNALVFGVGHTF